MIFASSPCARLWTRFAPAAEGSARAWTIGASRTPFCKSSWEVSFDAATPAELLRDVHAKLLDLYLNESRSGKDSLFDDTTLSSEAYLPLLADGWSHSILRDGTQTFRAPNKLCRLRHQYDAWAGSDAEAWAVSAGEPDDPYWEARFSRHAPTALAVAFTASLISAKPVIRTAKDVPLLTRHDLRLADGAPKQAPSRPAPVPPISAPARRR